MRTPWPAHSRDCNKGPVLGGDGVNICCITVGESVCGGAERPRRALRKAAPNWGRTTEAATPVAVTTEWWTMGDHYVLGFAPGLRSLQSLCESSASDWWDYNEPWPVPAPCVRLKPVYVNPATLGGGDSSVVRAPDSWLKGRGFESLLERRENFLLQHTILTLN